MVVSRAKDGKQTTEITIAENPSIRPVYAGQPAENGGLGTDFRPSQLLLAGYVSCMSVNLRHHLTQDGIPFEDVIISADLDWDEEGPTKIYTKAEIVGDIPQATKDEYIQRANSCYVKQILQREKIFLPME